MASFNGITKTTAKTNKQDYMNLLYTDSDSDQVPDLKLPPVKGKKQRRKKALSTVKDDGGCGLVCCFKTLLVLLVCATLVVLAGLSIWTLQRVSELQEQVDKLQSASQSNPEVNALQDNVKSLEASLTELKKGDGVLGNLNSSIHGLDVRLKKVEATIEKLNHSVSSAQSLLNLPKKVKDLTDVVAGIGSDVLNLKKGGESQEEKATQLDQRVSTLEAQLSSVSEEKKSGLDAQLGDALTQQISFVNDTTSTAIVSMKDLLNRLEARLSTVEGYAQPGLGHEEVETLVMHLMDEKIYNMTIADDRTVSESDDKVASRLVYLSQSLSDLRFQVGNLSQSQEETRSDIVTKDDLLILQNTAFTNFQELNETVFALNSEFVAIKEKMDTLDSALLNISSLVSQSLLKKAQSAAEISQEEETPEENDQTIVKSSLPPFTAGSSPAPLSPSSSSSASQVNTSLSTGNENNEEESSTGDENNEEITTRDENNEEEFPAQDNNEEESPKLSIEGIENADDLHQAFTGGEWELDNGQLDLDYAANLLQTDTETLNQYDTNSDGRLSEEEMMNVLG